MLANYSYGDLGISFFQVNIIVTFLVHVFLDNLNKRHK